LPVSIELGFYAFLLALLFGVTLGTISAIRPNSSLDHIPMSLSLLGICMPSFVIGPILLLVFSLKLHWFNVQGWQFTADKVLPTLTLSLFYTAFIARLTRSSLIETLNQDYIRTAIAKGLTPFRVIFVHALRNGISPVISYLGPALAGLISGSFVVETIFQIPGLGRFFVLSAINRDVSLTIGVVLFYAILILLFNLLVDILLVIINPKRSFND
jgi:oligopeptide transport system permease protein